MCAREGIEEKLFIGELHADDSVAIREKTAQFGEYVFSRSMEQSNRHILRDETIFRQLYQSQQRHSARLSPWFCMLSHRATAVVPSPTRPTDSAHTPEAAPPPHPDPGSNAANPTASDTRSQPAGSLCRRPLHAAQAAVGCSPARRRRLRLPVVLVSLRFSLGLLMGCRQR